MILRICNKYVQKVILLVEETTDFRQLMEILFVMFGYTVTEAENGEQAFGIVLEQPSELILMDMSMPVTDGLTAIKAFRNLNEKPKLRLLPSTLSVCSIIIRQSKQNAVT